VDCCRHIGGGVMSKKLVGKARANARKKKQGNKQAKNNILILPNGGIKLITDAEAAPLKATLKQLGTA
jgi:hypothetical protein